MMRVVVIRHHDVDSAGFIAAAFEARGAMIQVHLFPDDGPLPALAGVDHVVVPDYDHPHLVQPSAGPLQPSSFGVKLFNYAACCRPNRS